MDTVTDRRRNPFGMRPPCDHACGEDISAVFGYGDPNADFHLVGDHPGVHGGRETGVPFTGAAGTDRLLEALAAVGLLAWDGAGPPEPVSLFMSYLHLCCPPPDGAPTAADYADLERFFDAELRAVSAHVLLPVGERATAHVLEHFSAVQPTSVDPDDLHAADIAGRGFLIVPIRDPTDWDDGDRDDLIARLSDVLGSDYQQQADLTRFLPTDEPYLVR